MFKVGIATREVTCRLCGYEIKKGELVLRANLGSGLFYRVYHLRCFVEKKKEDLEKVLNLYCQLFNPSKRVN